jgi:formate/nitrite transporter FocA (FNT family)
MKHFEIESVHFAKVNKLKKNHEILKQISKLRLLSIYASCVISISFFFLSYSQPLNARSIIVC